LEEWVEDDHAFVFWVVDAGGLDAHERLKFFDSEIVAMNFEFTRCMTKGGVALRFCNTFSSSSGKASTFCAAVAMATWDQSVSGSFGCTV